MNINTKSICKIIKYGTKIWHNENGQYHREDGPAVEFLNGDKEWYINGERHRADGPAIEWMCGSKYWFINGKLHRKDGPAIICYDGTKEWWYNDKQLNCSTQEEFEKIIRTRIFWK